MNKQEKIDKLKNEIDALDGITKQDVSLAIAIAGISLGDNDVEALKFMLDLLRWRAAINETGGAR